MERRDFLRVLGLGIASGYASGFESDGSGVFARTSVASRETNDAVVTDEAFWRGIRAFYSPPSDYLDLDHANTSPTAAPVLDAFLKRSRRLSHTSAERFGQMWDEDVDQGARRSLAPYLGTQPERVAFVNSATTGLNTVLHGFPLERGVEILVTDHE
ncbi:MAG: aminotransferase class V-fold PLP-dependent enzyme [Gemmatimonadaceae bacterium]